MSVTYASKIDGWVVGLLIIPLLSALIAWQSLPLAMERRVSWWLVPTLWIAVGLPLWVVARTFYQFSATHLNVRSGPFR